MIGKLKYWNEDRGFGFIARDNQKENNVFVHARAFGENTRPQIGDDIEFEIQVADGDGRERAANARIVT